MNKWRKICYNEYINMVKRTVLLLSHEERKSQLNLIVSINNTLNMMQDRNIERKYKYKIEAVKTNSSGDELDTPRLETKYVKMKNKTVGNMYINVLEKQQILALQAILQEEQNLLYLSQVRVVLERRKEALRNGTDTRAGTHRVSQSQSTHTIDNDAWLSVKGTPVPRNTETPVCDASPNHHSTDFENKRGTQSRKSRSNIILNQQVTVRPDVNFARDVAIRKAKQKEKEEKEQKRWDGIKLKEIVKWDNLEVRQNMHRQNSDTEAHKAESLNKDNKNDDVTTNNGSGENIGGMMKFIYAPFFWLRKSINGD